MAPLIDVGMNTGVVAMERRL